MSDVPTRLHAAMFGAVSTVDDRCLVDGWLERHVLAALGVAVTAVEFVAGDVGAVWAVRLDDGRSVVVKALRPPVRVDRVRMVVRCQRALVRRGFPCPDVLDGPRATDGVVAVVEERLVAAGGGDPHQGSDRAAMAGGLARQIELLTDVAGGELANGAPAWSRWDDGTAASGGLWPGPHDPVFDFTTAATEYAWLDDVARDAAAVLRVPAGPPVVGHSDWVWQNVAVTGGRLLAGYDWDSLVWTDEPAIVGLCAGAFSQGSPIPPDAPAVHEVRSFVEEYVVARRTPFTAAERHRTDAATRWVRCYNARCQLDNLVRRSVEPPTGSFLDQLAADRYG